MTLRKAKEKAAAEKSKSKKCPSCQGTDHERPSSKKCPEQVKSRAAAPKKFKNLNKVCTNVAVIAELQKVVKRVTQVVYAGSMFANYFYLEKLENNKPVARIEQHLIYQLFSLFHHFNYDVQYETNIRNGVVKSYEKRTIRYFLALFSKVDHELFCGNKLSIAKRKALAHYIYQKKSNPGHCKWPSSVEKNAANESIVKKALKFWSEYDDATDKPPTEPKLYAYPELYLKWFHEIQKEMNIIQTNGHSVEFTFKKKAAKKSQSKATKGLTPKDFENEVKNNEAVVWGADPGVTEIYTAVDSGCTQDKERIRKTSTKE
ncbi:hypothetical protein HPULCUR_005672 [Helicostylum pulchrum]|uniref:Uncharacterized protein n=1 Tax=Helicostylum pulchrum TaxID=562976 RepID=A0ABP9XZQ5_9FUNG